MRRLWGVLILVALNAAARADGLPVDRGMADWSTIGAGGNHVSVARMGAGTGDAGKAPADYRVCNTTAMAGDGDRQTASVVPGGGALSFPLAPGDCACVGRPVGLQVISPHGTNAPPITGRYQRFKPGRGCLTKPLLAGQVNQIGRRACTALPPMTGSQHAAWSCNVLEGLPKRKRNVRFCSAGDESVINENNGVLNSGNYVVGSGKLVTESIVGPGGHLRPEFAVMADGCIDYYGIEELFVVAASGGIASNEIFLVKASWQALPDR